MTAADAVTTLREHAGGTSDASGPGFADMAWRFRQQREPLALAEPWRDICEALQALASKAGAWAQSGVPIEVAYPIAEILTSAVQLAVTEDDSAIAQPLVGFAWRVASGWEAVLAGDAEDINEHVTNEAVARGMPPLSDE